MSDVVLMTIVYSWYELLHTIVQMSASAFTYCETCSKWHSK